MGSKIESFTKTFTKGVARPNLFHVMMNPPAGLEWNNAEMELRVQSVTMPGKNITTSPNDNAYGPSYEMANGISYAEEIEVTYILDADHRAREFFNGWQDRVVNPSSYDLNYYDEYVGTMTIYQLDQNDNCASAVQVNEVFPKSVGPLQYSMDTTNNFMTVTVNMAFRNWTPLIAIYNTTDTAVWINNSNFNMGDGDRARIRSEVYGLASRFGIAIPDRFRQLDNQLTQVTNFVSDPTQFLKRTAQRAVGGRLGGLFGGF
jgi:hypothetical protein